MTDINLSPKARSLLDRAKGILLKPGEEWAVIHAEPATLQGLFTGYICILAAIPAIALTLGLVVFGWYGYHFGIGSALQAGVACYVTSLVAVAILGLALEFLGPQFGAPKDRVAAFKLAAYSMTAVWVGGIVFLMPNLASVAGLGALYGAYILYLGLPKLAPAPADKAQTWMIVAVIIALVTMGLVVGSGQASRAFGGGIYADNSGLTGTMNVPGYGSVDLGRAEAAGKAADAAIASALAEGSDTTRVRTVAASSLSVLLPGQVAGFSRGEVSATATAAGGLNTAAARATYTRGEGSIDLTVTDMGGAAAFAQLGSAFNVNHTEQTGGKYEKVANVGGRLTSEKYDNADRSGAYAVVVAERFMVEAEGRNVAMTDLKAAAASVGYARLEALARQG